ncbi:MAG TPA: hypothetical protein VNA18_05950 [Nitrososphaeraceae archaeon]|nr:hypothetical protein [Nitrososphaeraceae archaeon]
MYSAFGIQIANVPLGEGRRKMSGGQQAICSHNSITVNLIKNRLCSN